MIPKEKDTIRFAVGTKDNPLSLAWRIWVLGNNIFLGTKNGTQTFKVSLRDNDKWRMANVNALNQNDGDDDNVLYEWEKPTSESPEWIHSLSIVIPSIKHARPCTRNKAEDERILWIKSPQSDKCVILKILISWARMKRIDLEEVLTPGDNLLGSIKKQDGEKVWLIYREEKLSKAQSDLIQETINENGINTTSSLDTNMCSAILVTTDETLEVSDQPTIFDITLNKNTD